jgi:hypothetical protein
MYKTEFCGLKTNLKNNNKAVSFKVTNGLTSLCGFTTRQKANQFIQTITICTHKKVTVKNSELARTPSRKADVIS